MRMQAPIGGQDKIRRTSEQTNERTNEPTNEQTNSLSEQASGIKRHGSDAGRRVVAAAVDHAGDGGCGRRGCNDGLLRNGSHTDDGGRPGTKAGGWVMMQRKVWQSDSGGGSEQTYSNCFFLFKLTLKTNIK
ncbi:hypothetical protein C1H46_004910 [Malus baccata]|uniref:Uncharacterized protein n=1 Tax=Malus baccata TaxID=106549 RepID=A0A540NEE4_MALBA|nr:hypothetical protein C1H46_004910 [Malus baccata]